ncbi:hypothetical protein B566_EDAN017537 [Ephemera danica]|nr:hypothetical protein B566_EDAN017537 [Ephemera danica]
MTDYIEEMICIMCFFGVVVSVSARVYHDLQLNYDIGHYKLLQVNQTLELICKNQLNRDPPSWTYSSRLHNDPRMKLSQYVGESRLVISNAQAEDAGQYGCSSDHEYNGKTFHFNRTIEVIANEIKEVKVEEEKDSIKLLCDVHAYPSATVIWKIVYDNEDLNPKPQDPGEYEYWIPPDEKVVVDKSEGRWTLRPYNGVNNAELIIVNVTENDNGNYTCVSKSIAGDQSKDCSVRVTREAAGLGEGTIVAISVVLFSLNLIVILIILVVILGRRKNVTKFQQRFRSSRNECWKKSNNDVQENALTSFISTAATSSLPADEPCDATKLKGETECTVQVSLYNKMQQESWDV